MCPAIACAASGSPCVTKTRRGGEGMPSSQRTTSFQSACAEKPPIFSSRHFRNPLTQNLDLLLAVSNPAAQRSRSLVTNEHHGCIIIRQQSQRVMQDASSIHHSRRGDDDAGALHAVDALRFLTRAACKHRMSG